MWEVFGERREPGGRAEELTEISVDAGSSGGFKKLRNERWVWERCAFICGGCKMGPLMASFHGVTEVLVMGKKAAGADRDFIGTT